nr:3-isopropylmalate dehydratase large subunit, chloroplastic-like [Tanacetum cinerariifolium]
MVPQVPLLISFNVEEVGKQVAASTQTSKECNNVALASFIHVNVSLKFIRVCDETGNRNVHILRNFSKEQNIKYFYDITDHRDFMTTIMVCHLDQRTHLHAELNVSAAGPLNDVSPTHGKSLFVDTSQLLDDPDRPELEDITYSDDEEDVGAEANFTNSETTIIVSPIPTTRVHKDHLVT